MFVLCTSRCIFSTGLLREILREVQASNNRVAELEKKLEDLQEGEKESCAGKKKKVEPSPEVRVRVYVHVTPCDS